MKTNIKRLSLLLILCLLTGILSACNGSDDGALASTSSFIEAIPEEEMAAHTSPSAEPETTEEAPVEEEPEEDEDQPPREGMVRSALTGEWIDQEIFDHRTLAVMYPINQQALPQYGYDRVGVFYEIMEEGSMSRQMGIMEDWEDLDRIGNIRSIRDYFVYAGLEWDPVFIHIGGPIVYVKDILTRSDVDNINGVGGEMGSDYGAYYRIPAGSTSEHTAYTDGEHVKSAMERADFSLTHRDNYYVPEHFKFASKSNPNTLEQYPDAVEATEIDMTGSFPVTKSALTYNESDGMYYKRLYGNPQVDGATGYQLAFHNILIQKTYYVQRDSNGYLSFQMHDTTRDGYFITQGKMIHVTWEKTGDYEPTRYYDDDGNEIEVNIGKTMIFIIRDGTDSFTVNGAKYD